MVTKMDQMFEYFWLKHKNRECLDLQLQTSANPLLMRAADTTPQRHVHNRNTTWCQDGRSRFPPIIPSSCFLIERCRLIILLFWSRLFRTEHVRRKSIRRSAPINSSTFTWTGLQIKWQKPRRPQMLLQTDLTSSSAGCGETRPKCFSATSKWKFYYLLTSNDLDSVWDEDFHPTNSRDVCLHSWILQEELQGACEGWEIPGCAGAAWQGGASAAHVCVMMLVQTHIRVRRCALTFDLCSEYLLVPPAVCIRTEPVLVWLLLEINKLNFGASWFRWKFSERHSADPVVTLVLFGPNTVLDVNTSVTSPAGLWIPGMRSHWPGVHSGHLNMFKTKAVGSDEVKFCWVHLLKNKNLF